MTEYVVTRAGDRMVAWLWLKDAERNGQAYKVFFFVMVKCKEHLQADNNI